MSEEKKEVPRITLDEIIRKMRSGETYTLDEQMQAADLLREFAAEVRKLVESHMQQMEALPLFQRITVQGATAHLHELVDTLVPEGLPLVAHIIVFGAMLSDALNGAADAQEKFIADHVVRKEDGR